MSDTFTVSVCMITYNHEPYIKQAIESVLTQKCNFPFELIIGEDCSTDSTRQICIDYAAKHPEIILLDADSNLGMLPNFLRTLNKCTGKYIALCEGDDYWVDPFKLQKQVDFLENNSEYGLVHSNYYVYIEKIQKYKRNPITIKKDASYFEEYEELLKSNKIGTLTVCLRTDILKRYFFEIKPEKQKWLLGDYPVWIYFSFYSRIKFFHEKMAVYRSLRESASYSSNRQKVYHFLESIYDVKLFFTEKYGCSLETKELIRNNYFNDILKSKIKLGYDLRDFTLIYDCLEEKKTHKLPISILDRMLQFITKFKTIWLLSKKLLPVKRFVYEHSNKFSKRPV